VLCLHPFVLHEQHIWNSFFENELWYYWFQWGTIFNFGPPKWPVRYWKVHICLLAKIS
jgi:hypothetical protein